MRSVLSVRGLRRWALTPLGERIWPSKASQEALEGVLGSSGTTPTPIDPELLWALSDAASNTADYEVEYEYGYDGDVRPVHYVSNWPEVVEAILQELEGKTQ